MPPKKKSSSASADVCSICCQAIPPKDESLLCAGRCQQRFHRYCASVPEHQYKALCEKNTPFLCPACYREQRDGEVNELKSTVEALRIELSQLRELVREVREKVEGQGHNRAASANVEERPALTAARSGVGPPPKDPPGWKTILPRKSSKPRRPRDTIPNSNKPQREKVRIPGVRKVWGTMKSCTAHTVSNTIAQLCPTVSAKLQLRRKFKTSGSANGGRTTKWWFVIRGAEDVLIELQDKWENIALQTSWKLEIVIFFQILCKPPSNMSSTLLPKMHHHHSLPNSSLSLLTMPLLSSQTSQSPMSHN